MPSLPGPRPGQAFGQPMPLGHCPVRARHAIAMRGRGWCDTVRELADGSMMVETRSFCGWTVTGWRLTCCYLKTQKGRLERYDSPSRRSARRKETVSTGETCTTSVKHPVDGPRSCTSMRWTWGNHQPRSPVVSGMAVGPYWKMVDGSV
jgi:hypothetical protein